MTVAWEAVMGLAQWSCARSLTHASPHWEAESVETAFEKRNGTGFTGFEFLTSTRFWADP
jgi:hypothetical protein